MAPRTFRGHSDAITAIDCDPNFVFTSSYDATIRAWNPSKRTKACRAIFLGHEGPVLHIQISGKYLFSSSVDGYVIKGTDVCPGRGLRVEGPGGRHGLTAVCPELFALNCLP